MAIKQFSASYIFKIYFVQLFLELNRYEEKKDKSLGWRCLLYPALKSSIMNWAGNALYVSGQENYSYRRKKKIYIYMYVHIQVTLFSGAILRSRIFHQEFDQQSLYRLNAAAKYLLFIPPSAITGVNLGGNSDKYEHGSGQNNSSITALNLFLSCWFSFARITSAHFHLLLLPGSELQVCLLKDPLSMTLQVLVV